MVIKKELITKNDIQSPVGALGQDSLFFYELMLNARNGYHLALPIHIYYAQRESSVLNTVDSSFFKKFLVLEKYQARKFYEYGVLNEYRERKAKQFFSDWYLQKLMFADPEDVNKVKRILSEIENLY